MAEVFTYPNALPHASRVSITNGESVATFTDANVSGYDWSGAQLWIIPDDAQPYLAAIIADAGPDADYEATELDLVFPWNGTTISGAKFLLVGGAAFADPSRTAAGNSRFRNQTQQNMGLVGDVSDVTDYSHVLNNTILYDSTQRALYRWRSGTLEVLPISQLGNPKGAWKGLSPKHTLTISTGDVAVDLDDGPNYELTFDDDFELQLPTSVEQGDSFDILFTADGGGDTPSFASGFTGEAASVIRTDDGARTRLTFIVTAETGGTATAVTVAKVTYEADDIVEDGGFVFISNIAANFSEPPFTDPSTPSSDASWTWLPLPAGAAGSAVVTGTSTTSNTIGSGSKTFNLVELDPVRGFAPGGRLRFADSASPTTNYMDIDVETFDGEEVSGTVANYAGSGTISSWVVSIAPGKDGQDGEDGVDFEPDEVVATFADRDTFDDEAKNFAVLVEEDESKDGTAYLYFKLSASSADWSNGIPFNQGGGGGGSGLLKCRTVAITNITISSGLEAGDTVNGVTLAEDDVVLLTAQTAQAENGPYVVPASGAASRHSDFADYDAVAGSYFAVMEGTAKADTLWRCTSNFGGTIDSTSLAFEEVGGNAAEDYGSITSSPTATDDYGSIA